MSNTFFKIGVAENSNDLEYQQLILERQLLIDSKKQCLIGSKQQQSIINADVVSGMKTISTVEIKLEGVEKDLATCKNATKIKRLQILKERCEKNIKINREILAPRVINLEILAKDIQALEREIEALEHPHSSTYSFPP
ncbi:MAG: hypothetical protein Q8M03_07615 [Legionella sp.]|nr:hypothetical protein [Legionella sp.]